VQPSAMTKTADGPLSSITLISLVLSEPARMSRVASKTMMAPSRERRRDRKFVLLAACRL
jgi:hypothetical protein